LIPVWNVHAGFSWENIGWVDLVDVRKSRVIKIGSIIWPVKSLRTQRFDEGMRYRSNAIAHFHIEKLRVDLTAIAFACIYSRFASFG